MSYAGGARAKRSTCELLVYVPNTSQNEQTYFLAISSASRKFDAVLIKVKATTGELEFTNTPEVDVFPSVDDAKRYLETSGRYSVKKSGSVVLGYAIVACNAWVLLATGTEASAHLPGQHIVYTVTECSWQCIPLQIRTAYPEQDFKHGEMFNEFPVSGNHFFCESADVSRPFPSDYPVTQPCWEFVWNYYLTQPFRRVGLPEISPPIFQGMADQKVLRDINRIPYTVMLFARRSRLHAGTRYKARGLNNLAAPANEIECEQIILRAPVDSAKERGQVADMFEWSSYVWRRGSVPLRWSQTVKSNGVGTAIAIEAEKTFKGSRRYFRRLQMRYYKQSLSPSERDASGSLTPDQRHASLDFPVAVVNLLRKGSIDRDRSEARLYSAFCDLMSALNSQEGINIVNIGFDWHELAGVHGSLTPVVEMLWAVSGEHFESSGFNHGYLRERDPTVDLDVDASAWGRTMQAVRDSRQKGIFRFNCADSLDRTNVASFYSSLQVLLEQGRRMQLKMARHVSVLPPPIVGPEGQSEGTMGGAGRGAGAQSAKKMFSSMVKGMNSVFGSNAADQQGNGSGNMGKAMGTPPSPTPQKPRGWEKRAFEDAGITREVWVNHETKATSWTAPVEPEYKQWELVMQTVADMRRCVDRSLLLGYKDLFRVSGDRNAELYTGSAAMHSAQLDLLLTSGDAGHGLSGFINNAHTAVRRRINNIVTDDRTHSIFEMILGMPLKSTQDIAESYNQGVSFEISAEADKLPVTDDPDSDSEDVLGQGPWPAIKAAHTLSSISTAMSPPPPATGPRASSTPSFRSGGFASQSCDTGDDCVPNAMPLNDVGTGSSTADLDSRGGFESWGVDEPLGAGAGAGAGSTVLPSMDLMMLDSPKAADHGGRERASQNVGDPLGVLSDAPSLI